MSLTRLLTILTVTVFVWSTKASSCISATFERCCADEFEKLPAPLAAKAGQLARHYCSYSNLEIPAIGAEDPVGGDNYALIASILNCGCGFLAVPKELCNVNHACLSMFCSTNVTTAFFNALRNGACMMSRDGEEVSHFLCNIVKGRPVKGPENNSAVEVNNEPNVASENLNNVEADDQVTSDSYKE